MCVSVYTYIKFVCMYVVYEDVCVCLCVCVCVCVCVSVCVCVLRERESEREREKCVVLPVNIRGELMLNNFCICYVLTLGRRDSH